MTVEKLKKTINQALHDNGRILTGYAEPHEIGSHVPIVRHAPELGCCLIVCDVTRRECVLYWAPYVLLDTLMKIQALSYFYEVLID